MGISTRNKVNSWGLSASMDLGARVAKALENIPFEGLLTVQEQSLSALVYECPQGG
jgi:hypothetical protein